MIRRISGISNEAYCVMQRKIYINFIVGLIAAVGLVHSGKAESLLEQFEHKVTELTLENGLTFLVIERHEAPVVSFHTYADVGSANEPIGATGVAHMFEHMAFKGTTSIGTKDIEKEMAALKRQERIYKRLRRAQLNRDTNPDKLDRLKKRFKKARKEAEKWSQAQEFERILKRAGVNGLNAYTSADATGYMYSLPANKVKLFFAMESDRFLNPVMREFYVERDVVMEERRQRVGSSPLGRLVEEWQAAAFIAHPYGQPTIGHMSDLKHLTRTQAREFFEAYYVPKNLTIAIAGDVDPDQIRKLAEKYFGRLPSQPPPLPIVTEEPKQRGERQVTLVESTQPYVLMGYHRPSIHSPDHATYLVLSDILSRGRTSRFYQNLVEKELALQANAFASFPGNKNPGLFGILGVPSKGVSPKKLEKAILDELDRLKTEAVSEQALERAKTRARSDLINGLDSNSGLAKQFSTFEALTGNWRNLFRQLDDIDAVDQDDVKRVAKETFKRSNRTVARIRQAQRDNEKE